MSDLYYYISILPYCTAFKGSSYTLHLMFTFHYYRVTHSVTPTIGCVAHFKLVMEKRWLAEDVGHLMLISNHS
jgi:hypothetical protein